MENLRVKPRTSLVAYAATRLKSRSILRLHLTYKNFKSSQFPALSLFTKDTKFFQKFFTFLSIWPDHEVFKALVLLQKRDGAIRPVGTAPSLYIFRSIMVRTHHNSASFRVQSRYVALTQRSLGVLVRGLAPSFDDAFW